MARFVRHGHRDCARVTPAEYVDEVIRTESGRDISTAHATASEILVTNGIDPLNAEKIDLLELVWSNLLRLYDAETARAWLHGLNPQLDDRRPIDVIRTGRVEDLMRAIRAERADAFA